MRPAGLAFFDFDNTLIDGDAGPLFGRHLVHGRAASRGRLRTLLRYVPFMAWMVVQSALYRVGAVRRSTVVRNAYKGLRGVEVAQFEDELDAFVDALIPPRVLPGMVEEIRGHQAAGRRCVVVTTGMERLVERAMRHFPDGVAVIGCRLEERDGRFTGRVTGPLFGQDKANIVMAYAKATSVALSDCFAYTDHWSDKQMLEVVGHGAVVRPRGRLKRVAARRGWRVLQP